MRLLLLFRRAKWYWFGLLAVLLIASAQFAWMLQSLMHQGFYLFPYQDDWGTPVNFLTTYADGTRTLLEGLWRQHNESRKLTYKLIVLFLDQWQRIDSFISLWFSFAVRIATVIVVCWPLKWISGITSKSWQWSLLAVLAYGSVIYGVGPANLFNGFWFVQTSFFLGILFSVLCLHSFWGAVIGRRGMALLAAASGSLAIFSFSGNTSLLPVCSVCALALIPGSCLRAAVPWKSLALILGALALSTACFFWNWGFPPAHYSLRSDDISLRYLLKFMAGFYQFLPTQLFLFFQASVLALILFVGWFGFSTSVRHLIRNGHVGLIVNLTQALFLLLLAASSSVARGGTPAGSAYALEYRYNSISILFSILLVSCLLQVAWIWRGRTISACGFGLAGIFAGLGFWANLSWLPVIQAHFSIRSEAVSCLKSYVSRRHQGESRDDLSGLAVCARPLFDKGPELIYNRFSKACSTPVAWRGSRTLSGLCDDFGLKIPRSL